MYRKRFAACAGFFCWVTLLSGCGDGKGVVKGTVTFDGKPVKNGAIVFISTDGPLVREGSVIIDGSFETRVLPGKYKVELNAQKVSGKRIPKGFDGKDEEIILFDELFPEYFNSKSELNEIIKAGDNHIKLDLKTKR